MAQTCSNTPSSGGNAIANHGGASAALGADLAHVSTAAPAPGNKDANITGTLTTFSKFQNKFNLLQV